MSESLDNINQIESLEEFFQHLFKLKEPTTKSGNGFLFLHFSVFHSTRTAYTKIYKMSYNYSETPELLKLNNPLHNTTR